MLPRSVKRRVIRLWPRLGLRAQVEIFVLIAITPLILLIFAHFWQHREERLAQARQHVLSLAERGAEDHAQTLRHVHSTLRMLALVPDIRWAMPRSCNDILHQARDLNPWAVGFAVADLKGALLCGTVESRPDDTVEEHQFFRRVLREKSFVTGGYWHRGEGEKPALAAALPILNRQGVVERVLLTGIDLEWMSGISQEIARSAGGIVTLVASDGLVINRVPDVQSFTGRMMGDHPVVAHAVRNGKGTVDGAGLDSVLRIHGFARLPASDSTLIVGIGHGDVVGPINAEVMTSAAIVLAVVLGITVGVWFLMDVLVLRGLRNLQQSAARLSTGQIDGLSPCAPASIAALEVGKAVQAVRRMGQTLRTVAFTDPLTGLANRRFFDAHVERSEALPRAERTPQAVLCIDLDGFKPVNDRYGHAVGDAVLKAVASRLMRCVREVDHVVRFGGDEFAILLDLADQPDEEQALRVADRVVKALSAPVKAEGVELRIGCSVGIAVWPTDDQSFDTVLRYADQALYSAKRMGRGQARRHRDLIAEREQRPDAV